MPCLRDDFRGGVSSQVSDSLYDFLSFSIKLIRLEIIDYQGEILF